LIPPYRIVFNMKRFLYKMIERNVNEKIII
jgi:hypothetical protein